MSFVVIIRGPLGIGKTTIAKKIAEILKGEYISVDDILANNNLDFVDEKIGCISEENFLKVNQIILPRIKALITNNVSVIIDGNFYHKNQIENLINNIPLKTFVITLVAPVEICIQRDSERSPSHGKEAAVAVHNLVSKFNYGQVIDIKDLTAEETIKIIISGIEYTLN